MLLLTTFLTSAVKFVVLIEPDFKYSGKLAPPFIVNLHKKLVPLVPA